MTYSSQDDVGMDGLTTSTSEMLFTATWSHHDKLLECQALNSEGHPGISISVRLYVYGDVKNITVTVDGELANADTPVVVAESDRVTLNCTALGARPSVSVTWYDSKTSKIMNSTETTRVNSINVNTTDTIGVLSLSGRGCNERYELECRVSGQQIHNHYSRRVTLRVQEDIGSFTGPSDVTVMTNATVSLSCRAGHCVPISFSAWVNNNVNFAAFQSILRNDAKYDNFDINSTDRCIGQMDLLVTNAQPEDAGIYTCQINGEIREATLNVEEDDKQVENMSTENVEQLGTLSTVVGEQMEENPNLTRIITWIAGPLVALLAVILLSIYAGMKIRTRTKQRAVTTAVCASSTVDVGDDDGTYLEPNKFKEEDTLQKTGSDTSIGELENEHPSDNIPLRETDGLRAYVTKIHDPAASFSPRLSFINEYHNVGPSLKFPRHRIWIEKELGRGAFGRVLQGIALGIDSSGERKKVAVKTLKEDADDCARSELLEELRLMKKLGPHPNIITLLGHCTKIDPIYVIVEYMSRGDLKTLLGSCKTAVMDSAPTDLPGLKENPSKTFVKFAKDVASGMEFLSSQNCIHRDLAARNVLVSEDMVCKVADFGLARDVMNVRIYQRQSQGPLPIRWMAIESLVDDVFTTKSDVWSFGILLWEIVTFGARPYPLLGIQTMLSKLRSGYRMPKPACCKQQLYCIMLSCWKKDPQERSSFTEISKELGKLHSDYEEYIRVDKLAEVIYDDVDVPDEKL
ncbi:fibroblast growth factor receptor 1-like [Asterias rubens]|uniref:fibroblast growth factor receptor 1-like n=1 Tax=Asterias rubens TaxID=7604 RepID=UPI00145517F2|nr:fibroblast growth factor receptor 1-like [Asterias rubens]